MELKNYYINCEATRYGLVHVEAHDQDEAIKRLHDAYEKGIVRPECLKPAMLRLRDDTDIFPNSGRSLDIHLWYDTEITDTELDENKETAPERTVSQRMEDITNAIVELLIQNQMTRYNWEGIREDVEASLHHRVIK